MSQPFVGEIRMFGGNFAPAGWMFCNGQLLPISEYETLFNLIGTTYGGDGQQTFALPNLQSRIPIHAGPGFVLSQALGAEMVTLTTNQLPSHNHFVNTATGAQVAATNAPGLNILADATFGSPPSPQPFPYAAFSNDTNQRTLGATTVGNTGGGQPHENMVPFVAVNFILSLFGVYPSQS